MRIIVLRTVLLAVSFLATFGLIETATRLVDKGGLPSLPMFAQLSSGLIVLADDVMLLHSRRNGSVYSLSTTNFGLRRTVTGETHLNSDWIAVGDSQVLGLGVADTATFSAIVTSRGLRMANAGVPGHGVEDALQHAEYLLPLLKSKGVLVVVNQANDWEEVGHLASERLRVRGSWLLQPDDATGWVGAFMASPLSRSHFLFYAAKTLHFALNARTLPPQPPAWLVKPGGQGSTTDKIAEAINAFAKSHSELRIIACFIPVDVAASQDRAKTSPFGALISGKPWENHDLRDQLVSKLHGVEWIDALTVLRDRPDAFLDDDYHLSETGHVLMANAIAQQVADPRRAR